MAFNQLGTKKEKSSVAGTSIKELAARSKAVTTEKAIISAPTVTPEPVEVVKTNWPDRDPKPSAQAPVLAPETVADPKVQIAVAGPVRLLEPFKLLSKANKNSYAEMIGEMQAIYERLEKVGRRDRYGPKEFLEMLLQDYEKR